SGVHLRPYSDKADDTFASVDLWTYQEIGRRLTAITGYPNLAVYHGFRYDPKDVITGVADDWAFDSIGVFAWTTEFWNPLAAAGIEGAHPIDWFRDHPHDDDLKLLAWADDNAPGGYVEWYPFEHAQLGPVELGGWNVAAVFRNPPSHLLESEVAPHSEAAVLHALLSPLLRLRTTEVERLGPDTWRLRVVVENSGWLPTNVTQKAIERKVVRPVEATIVLPDDASLVAGKATIELGQLGGRALRTNQIGMFGIAMDGTADRAKAEWVVRAPAGTEIDVRVAQPRAGVATATLTLAPDS
ncbi:MAG TPA: hypothetical protein VF855_07720, partial [Acidimicrobiales bacterium]